MSKQNKKSDENFNKVFDAVFDRACKDVVEKLFIKNFKKWSSQWNVIGSDETGKGEVFKELTTVAAYVKKSSAAVLESWDVKDSKELSKTKLSEIAQNLVGEKSYDDFKNSQLQVMESEKGDVLYVVSIFSNKDYEKAKTNDVKVGQDGGIENHILKQQHADVLNILMNYVESSDMEDYHYVVVDDFLYNNQNEQWHEELINLLNGEKLEIPMMDPKTKENMEKIKKQEVREKVKKRLEDEGKEINSTKKNDKEKVIRKVFSVIQETYIEGHEDEMSIGMKETFEDITKKKKPEKEVIIQTKMDAKTLAAGCASIISYHIQKLYIEKITGEIREKYKDYGIPATFELPAGSNYKDKAYCTFKTALDKVDEDLKKKGENRSAYEEILNEYAKRSFLDNNVKDWEEIKKNHWFN